MSYLSLLRTLADQQRHADLEAAAGDCWRETADPAVLPLWALAAAQLGRRGEAQARRAEADRWLPGLDVDAQVDLAAVDMLLLRVDSARALLQAALSQRPAHVLALSRLAWCEAQDGRLADARALYAQALAQAPGHALIALNLARTCVRLGEHAPAQAVVDTIASWVRDGSQNVPAAVLPQLTALQLEIWVATDCLPAAEAWLAQRRESLSLDAWLPEVAAYAAVLAGRDRHAAAEELLTEALALALQPQSVALQQQLAELAQWQGRPQQAAGRLRRALALAEPAGLQAVALWTQLAGVLLHESLAAARDAASRAVALAGALAAGAADPGHAAALADARCALAAVDSQDANYEAADAAYRAVLAEHPWCLAALHGLGQQQLQRGRLDEAVSLFERVKMLNPVRGASALISARQVPKDPAELARLEACARQPSLEGSVRTHLLFQLAAAWEKCGDPDKAFALASEANAGSRRLLAYDARQHRQRCARIRAAFTKELYQHRPGCGSDSTLPVFVLGMPRSGTTLVEQILAGHSQVHGAGELGLVPGVIAGLERWERRTGSGRHYPDCVDDLTPQVAAGIAAQVLKEMQADAPGARHVIDKLPHNFENIGLIKFLFPQAKIISVRRDPRDIAVSNFFTDYQAKHSGMGFAYDLADIGEQLADHNLLMHHWHQLFPGQILEVQYEEVVADTEGQAQRMLEYLGLAWEPQVLQFNQLDRPVKTASVWQVRQPIYTTSQAKWKRYEKHLAPLVRGTNARIVWEPIADMATLPQPGWLHEGWACYREGRLDDAERCFRQLLHHLPEHAAAAFMVGLIGVRKGHGEEGLALMERGLAACPWNADWRAELARACELGGRAERAAELRREAKQRAVPVA